MSRFLFAFLVVFSAKPTLGQTFTAAHIDSRKRIVATTTAGPVRVLAKSGRYSDPELSDDQLTIVWQVLSTIQYHGAPIEVSSRVNWYRGARSHSFSAGVFLVRSVWFVERGQRIGVNIGGMHFAGLNVLLDASTGKELDSFADLEKATKPIPGWVEP